MSSRHASVVFVSCSMLVAVSTCRTVDSSIAPTSVIESVHRNDAGTQVEIQWQKGGGTTAALSDFLPPVCDPRMNAPIPYPDELRDAGLVGDLELKCLVLTSGELESCAIAKGLDERIDRQALDAVRGWRCSPAMVRGVPLASAHVTRVRFEPPPAPPAAPQAAPVAAVAPPKLAAAGALPAPIAGAPKMKAPDTNPLTPEKAELGALLFADTQLSGDGSASCATCHRLESGFASGAVVDVKVGGAKNTWNTPSLLNVGAQAVLGREGTWKTLEACVLGQWKDQLGADPERVAAKLNEQPVVKALFVRAFPGTPGATSDSIQKALASYVRTMTTGNAPWDRSLGGDKAAVSKDVQRGWALFDKLGCTECHRSPRFIDAQLHPVAGAKGALVKTPSLRGLAKTGPYLADGSAKTLEEALGTHLARLAKPGTKAPKVPPKDLAAVKSFLDALNGDASVMVAPALP